MNKNLNKNLLNQILLNIPDEPELLPSSADFVVPANLLLPHSWIAALSRDSPSKEYLQSIWQPLMPYIPKAVERIIECTRQLGLAIFPSDRTTVFLVYVFQDEASEMLIGWLAGLPIPNHIIAQTETKLKIRLPASFKEFAKVHNGFTLYPMDVGPAAVENLWFISDSLHSEPDLEYQPDKLLAFSGDGAGNQQCYDFLSPLDHGDYWTYDWDHETYQLSKPTRFWDYLEQLILTELSEAKLQSE